MTMTIGCKAVLILAAIALLVLPHGIEQALAKKYETRGVRNAHYYLYSRVSSSLVLYFNLVLCIFKILFTMLMRTIFYFSPLPASTCTFSSILPTQTWVLIAYFTFQKENPPDSGLSAEGRRAKRGESGMFNL